MRKPLLGFSLMLSASIGLSPIINGIMEYVLSYDGYHKKWLIFNFITRFHLQYLILFLIGVWIIGLYILCKEYFSKD
ncbi:hypothetical protein M3685_18055 [Heyndrickxia oleronia]|jgi:membrane associated rhomboid family serine protease|uniref:Uncharacterized protein n=1 Tax=Heyndrickxia oleronia TaxID=38875 RepID=A0A8E2I7N0_9BACI|nr:hypothetical protein [Heyndrickxia oleronia]MBU5214035.1 hypothetical protein [Heyndrickxia oleronia]MCM3455824.1 hypothetical protein [Heyndrickxia oleronia]MEC1375503.1 hypothetical protein [Heyndrickxia oleronia]OOP66373.1 hypothetical protein BWZ43_21370 [Heyndrickxia oleronia]QQZ04016.1 hypothetical protein I5818_20300 [Heyndrickxia oleronia]